MNTKLKLDEELNTANEKNIHNTLTIVIRVARS
jgi:hypothetical protein